jgi:regulator of sigma E protease
MLSTVLYFILALLLLVTVHEYGHFQVARWCGVKVLRFSFGFGPILLRLYDRKGTEYVWSLIPLGGYVKMLDEAEAPVPDAEKHMAFNQQSLLARAAIVIAGPLFNFLFAFVALWLVLVIGIYSLAPIVDSVTANSIAARAGLNSKQEIIALNDTPINSWREVQYALMPFIGSSGTLVLQVKSLTDGHKSRITLPLSDWHLDDKKPDPIKSLGIIPFEPSVPPIIGEVLPDSPGQISGLQVGDIFISVDGNTFDDWNYLVNYVKNKPLTKVVLALKRNGRLHQVPLVIGEQELSGKKVGYIGIRSQKIHWPPNWLRLEREGPIKALGVAFKQTIQLTTTTFTLMGRLLTGQLGLKSISGPVGIAEGAGDSGRSGLVYYLFFLALVSISLGALNLLPIPMLDGGHLLFYAIEIIRGKPLSDKAKSAGVTIGLLLLFALMCVSLSNDIARLGT